MYQATENTHFQLTSFAPSQRFYFIILFTFFSFIGFAKGRHTLQTDQTITFNAISTKTYGDAAFMVSATASSGLDISFSIVSGAASVSGNTITVTGAGEVIVKASQPGNEEYNSAETEQSFTVLKKNVTVTISADSKEYDGNNSAVAHATISGVVSGDDILVNTNAGFDTKDIGINKTVTATIILSGNDANNYTANSTATAVAGITPKIITSVITAANKNYDGTVNATLLTQTLTGVVSGESVSCSSVVSYFEDKNAGINKTVYANGITLTGTDKSNYKLNANTAITYANIIPKTISPFITANNKVYDSKTTAFISNHSLTDTTHPSIVTLTRGSDNGVYLPDASSITPGSVIVLQGNYKYIRLLNIQGTADKPVIITNNGLVTVGGLSQYTCIFQGKYFKVLGNGDAAYKYGIKTGGLSAAAYGPFGISLGNSSNVEIAYVEMSLASSGIISNPTTGGLMVDNYFHNNYIHDLLNPKAQGRAEGFYLGSTASGLPYNATFRFVNCRIENNILENLSGDGIQMSQGTFICKGNTIKNFATAQLAAQRNALEIGGNANAQILGNTIIGGKGDALNMFGYGNIEIAYNYISGIDVTGLGDQDVIYINAKFDTSQHIPLLNLNFHDNYIEGNTDRVIINEVTVPYRIEDILFKNNILQGIAVKPYSINKKDVWIDGTPANMQSTQTADGSIAGEYVNITAASANFDNKNVGTGKRVTVEGLILSGTDKDNYTLSSPTATLTADITPATLTATFIASDKIYDGNRNASATASVTPLSNDVVTVSIATPVFDTKNVGSNKTITANLNLTGIDKDNYALTNPLSTTHANITPAGLTATLTAADKIYDGNTNAAAMAHINPLNADEVTVSVINPNFDNKNVGINKTVSADLSLGGGDANNYTLNTAAAIGKANITPNAITVTADAKTKIFGDADPSLTYRLTQGALVGGDVFSGVLGRDPGESPGVYPITQGTLSLNNNYVLSYQTNDLTIVDKPISIILNSDNINCYGGSATLTAIASGGYGDLSYSLNGTTFQSSNSFTVNAGSYYITVKDEHNTTKQTNTIIINEPLAINGSLNSQTNVSCNGSSDANVTVDANGGTGNLSYSIDGINFNNTSGTFNNLSSGNYTITIKDENSCKSSIPVTITQPQPLSAIITGKTNASCTASDGSITVGASGGSSSYQYSLNGVTYQSNNIFNNLAPGNYTITVKDAKNCTTSASASISQSSGAITVDVISSAILCNGGTATLIVNTTSGSSPYQYSLNGGAYQNANTFTVSAGTYTVAVKDAKGCTGTSNSLVVTQPALLKLTTSKTNASCNSANGVITATGSGGTGSYQYNLNSGSYQASATFSGLSAGNYTVGVKDANGCTSSSAVTITQSSSLTASISSTLIACNNGSSTITVTASGGTTKYQYSLNGGIYQTGKTFTVKAGIYQVTVKDAKGCIAQSNSLTITQPPVLAASNSSQVNVSCRGGSDGKITVSATGGTPAYQYSKDGTTYQTTNVFAGLKSGKYTIRVKDANNCSTSYSATITQPSKGCVSAVVTTKMFETSIAKNSLLPFTISVLPNPSASRFSLFVQSNSNKFVTIRVFNMYGRNVYQTEGSANQQFTFGSNFISGMYTVQVVQGDQLKILKIIKSN